MNKEELKLDYQKAYEVFKETMREGNYSLAVKSALEKQIPKKPIYEDVGNVYGALKRTCANCGDVCLVSKDAKPYERYCRFCGNLLDDWSDSE